MASLLSEDYSGIVSHSFPGPAAAEQVQIFTHPPPCFTVHMELFVVMHRVWFLPNIAFCMKTKHFHLGYPKGLLFQHFCVQFEIQLPYSLWREDLFPSHSFMKPILVKSFPDCAVCVLTDVALGFFIISLSTKQSGLGLIYWEYWQPSGRLFIYQQSFSLENVEFQFVRRWPYNPF